jgi:hypothetical protein
VSYTKSFAEQEFAALEKSWDKSNPDNQPLVLEFKDEIIALCEKFGNSGQSGGSAPYVASAIADTVKKLCLQKSISPITGTDDEWGIVSDVGCKYGGPLWQNKRCSALFKDNSGCRYLDAIVWKGDTEGESGNAWDTFTGTVEGLSSSQYVKSFPFTPKTFYIDVTRELLPLDWEEEPYFKNEYYDTKVYEETGVREWKVEKYRYKIKYPKQLERVWKYYDKLPTEL